MDKYNKEINKNIENSQFDYSDSHRDEYNKETKQLAEIKKIQLSIATKEDILS
jgi:hypothetical protein